MIVLAALVISTLAFAILLSIVIAVAVGIHQAHPTDLALQRRTHLEALTRRILGLNVRRGGPVPQADSAAGWDRAAR